MLVEWSARWFIIATRQNIASGDVSPVYLQLRPDGLGL